MGHTEVLIAGVKSDGQPQNILVNDDGAVITVAESEVLDDIALTVYGLKSWSYNILQATNSQAMNTQRVNISPIPVREGVSYSKIWVSVSVLGTSTAPTAIYLGLGAAGSATGELLAVTANEKDNAKWTATLGAKSFDLTEAYTPASDRIVYGLFLKNGVFAGTDISLGRNVGGANWGTLNGIYSFGNGGTGQTTIPDPMTFASDTSNQPFWVGLS